MKKASDLFVEALEAEGVEYVFGIPGEENLDMVDSLSRSTKIKLILTRHEQAAGFMAATYGRFTGKTGVCMATLGPGATDGPQEMERRKRRAERFAGAGGGAVGGEGAFHQSFVCD